MVNEKELNDKIIKKIRAVWDYYIKYEEDKDDKEFRENNFHIMYFDLHKLTECVDEALKKDNTGNYIYTTSASQIKKIFENEKTDKKEGNPDKAFFYKFHRYPMYYELLERMIDAVMLIYGIDGRKTGKFLRENKLPKDKKELKIRFIENHCWKCGELYHIYYVMPDKDSNNLGNNDLIFNDEVISKVKEWLNNNKHNLVFGEIKKRYSKFREEEYISFGCPKCDAIFGDWFLNEIIIDTIYDDKGCVDDIKINI